MLLYLYPFEYLGNKYRINLINNELCCDSTLSGVLVGRDGVSWRALSLLGGCYVAGVRWR